MNYYLNVSGNTWKAQTFCYEDMGSMASLFIYKSKNGTLLESDCIKKHERTIEPGTSLSRTYASVTFTNKKANYAKSTHALLLLNTNTPYISALDLYKGK